MELLSVKDARLAGSVGKRIVIMGGPGDDALVVTATAKLRGPADILLGSGNDKFTLDAKATITPLRVIGGEGTNTFVGSRTRAGLTLIRF